MKKPLHIPLTIGLVGLVFMGCAYQQKVEISGGIGGATASGRILAAQKRREIL